VREKNFGKKFRLKKIEKKRFLYSHEYRDQKMGGNKRAKNFCRNTIIVRAKNWEKSSEKVRKMFFYNHTNIVTKKWGEKTRETIFPETHE